MVNHWILLCQFAFLKDYVYRKTKDIKRNLKVFLKVLVIVEYIQFFFSKRPLSQLFSVVECEAVSIGTLFHPGATLKLDESEKFRELIKIVTYFVQGCPTQ